MDTDPRHQPGRRDLQRYPFVHEIRSRFGDIDVLGHINNVAIARFHEDARVEFFRTLFGLGGPSRTGAFHFLVAELRINYLGEAHHPASYRLGVGITRIGTSSVAVGAGVFLDGVCLGLGDTTMVHRTEEGTAPLPPERRAILEKALLRAD